MESLGFKPSYPLPVYPGPVRKIFSGGAWGQGYCLYDLNHNVLVDVDHTTCLEFVVPCRVVLCHRSCVVYCDRLSQIPQVRS